MILILSFAQDLHAARVIEQLRRKGADLFLLDLANFPRGARIELGYGQRPGLRYRERSGALVDFDEVRAAWWRRPQPYEFDSALTDITFAATECEEAVSGLWSALDARWMNPPVLDAAAHKKTYQLRLAEKVGLALPETLVTNSPASAQAFAERLGRVVYKPFAGSDREWRETRLFGETEQANLAAIRHAPVIFQEFIPGADYRITIVGEHVYVASIDARDAGYPVDFRMNIEGLQIREETLPADLVARLRDLMQRLGLVYGAIDLRLDERSSEFKFLEINPAGQFLFVEEAAGLPISEGVADTLIALSQR